jgi:DUF4097 and DUF4098 domain-containing protein YvlB
MKARITYSAVILAALALATVACLSGPVLAAQGRFERTLKVTGPVELEVTTGSGNIDVRTGDAASVQVRGTIRVSHNVSPDVAARKIQSLESHPPIEQTGNFIRIGRIEDPELRRNVSISYDIVAPAKTRLRSNTGSGDQTVSGLAGPVRAGTGSGNLRISNVADETHLETGSGDIEASSVQGAFYAQTGSGNIRAHGISGSIRAHSGSGDLTLDQTSNEPIRAETGSGNLEVDGARSSLRAEAGSGNITVTGQPGGDWKLNTGSGNIRLRLSAQAAFDLYAHTGSGSINTDLPITVQGSLKRHEIRGKVRGGGSLVDIGTGSGDIHIE